MTKKEFAILIGVMLCVCGVVVSSANIGRLVESERLGSAIHNAYITGDKITVDGIDYHVIVMPEAEELQALRSSYARRCQTVTEKFFNDMK